MTFPSEEVIEIDEDGKVTIPNKLYLSIEELKTIYELLEHHYIDYENIAAIQLVRKIRDILCQHGSTI